MKKFILLCSILLTVLSSCSDDDSIIKTETENFTGTENLIELNFIPTIENYFSKDRGTGTYRSSTRSGDWIHEFDEKGRLLKSQLFEKYPERILKEIIFSEYDIEANKVSLQVTTFNYFTLSRLDPQSYELIFDESYILKSIRSKYENEPGEVTVLKKLDDNKRIVLLRNGLIDELVGYEYDEQGNILKYIVYDTELVVKSIVEYSYTEFGDLKSYFFKNTAGAFSKADYFYRSDNTLERLEESFDYGLESAGNSVFTYSQDESFLKRIKEYENGKSEVAIYNGAQIVWQYFSSNQILTEIFKTRFSESKGRFYLEEYEKYDDDGNLEFTEYYDEDGNLTETVRLSNNLPFLITLLTSIVIFVSTPLRLVVSSCYEIYRRKRPQTILAVPGVSGQCH